MHVQLRPGGSANDCKRPRLSDKAACHHRAIHLTTGYWGFENLTPLSITVES